MDTLQPARLWTWKLKPHYHAWIDLASIPGITCYHDDQPMTAQLYSPIIRLLFMQPNDGPESGSALYGPGLWRRRHGEKCDANENLPYHGPNHNAQTLRENE